jgi:hypothetical protein
MLMKPLGDSSVLDERLSKKFMTVSPILILLISYRRSGFFAAPAAYGVFVSF